MEDHEVKNNNRTRKYIITRTWPKIVHHVRSPIIYATLENSGFWTQFMEGTLTIQAGLVPTRDDEFDANEAQHDPNPIPPRGGATCWREKKHMKKSSLNPRNHPKSFHGGLFNSMVVCLTTKSSKNGWISYISLCSRRVSRWNIKGNIKGPGALGIGRTASAYRRPQDEAMWRPRGA